MTTSTLNYVTVARIGDIPPGQAMVFDVGDKPIVIAHVEGDDLRSANLFDGALTANAYLGAFGIASALTRGADIVVTGRVTDASVVVGPAIAHHGWSTTSYGRSPRSAGCCRPWRTVICRRAWSCGRRHRTGPGIRCAGSS